MLEVGAWTSPRCVGIKKLTQKRKSSPAGASDGEARASAPGIAPVLKAEANAFLAAIVDGSEDAIVSKNLDGIITSWNQSAERIFGYSASEAVGEPIDILIPRELAAEEKAIIQRLKRGERTEHFETVRLRKDGTRIVVSLTISPVKNQAGEIIGASKIARDITERKQYQQRLQEERERLQVTLASIGDGVSLGIALNFPCPGWCCWTCSFRSKRDWMCSVGFDNSRT
jgi:PAS domain S-box-containing protein